MLSSHDSAPAMILYHRALLLILYQVKKLREFWQGCSLPWLLLFQFLALGIINHDRDR
jgi:hypothetical protein